MKTLQKPLLFIVVLLVFGQMAWAQGTVDTESALRTAVQSNQTVTLGTDITLSNGRLNIDGTTVTLNLNGHKLTRPMTAADAGGQVIAIMNSGKLTITDSGTGGQITGGWAHQGGGIYVYEGCELTISGGNITATALGNGPGIGRGYTVASHSSDRRVVVSIEGGNVTATGGNNAAGIGTGEDTNFDGSISISGGEVTAKGATDNTDDNQGRGGAGIGSGAAGVIDGEGLIQILGGSVTASADGGSAIGAGGTRLIGSTNTHSRVWRPIQINGDNITLTLTPGKIKELDAGNFHLEPAEAIRIDADLGGSLSISGKLAVTVDGTTCTAADRVSTLQSKTTVNVKPCDHQNATYTDNGEGLNYGNCTSCYGTGTQLYTFQTAGNWNISTNWLGGILPNTGKDVAVRAAATIPANCCAHVGHIDLQEGGSITIADGGQLIHSDAVYATVKKDILGYETQVGGWNFIATPIAAGTTPSMTNGLLDISGNSDFDLYYYDEPTHYWRNHKESESSTNPNFRLNNGQGYLYAHSNAVELLFEGTLQAGSSDGTYTVNSLSHGAPELTGFNLVGNPFTCNATIDRPFYVINGGNIVANTGSTIIPPCTGVMVQADAEHESVTFTKATTQQSSQPSQLQIVLAETNNTRGASAPIGNAIVSFDKGGVLKKFTFNEDNAQISLPQDGKDYAIISMGRDAKSCVSTEMPLNFKATKDGTYTLSFSLENMDLDYLHLIDNMTGADVDLLTPPAFGHPLTEGDVPLLRGPEGVNALAIYTFTAKTTDYASRFRLVFSSVCEDADGDNETFAFVNNGNIIVNGEGTLQVIDMTGRVIVCRDARTCVSTNGMTPGVYVLRLVNGDNVRTQKVVIE